MSDLLADQSGAILNPGTGLPWGRYTDINLLCADPPPARETWTVAWTGWEPDDAAQDPRRVLPSPRVGMGAAFEDLAARLQTLARQRMASRLALRPHASHVLSDTHSTRAMLDRLGTDGPRVVLEPAALLTPGMLDRVEDHLHRIVDSLADHPALIAVSWSSVALDDSGAFLSPAPIGGGLLDPGLLRRLRERCCRVPGIVAAPPGVH